MKAPEVGQLVEVRWQDIEHLGEGWRTLEEVLADRPYRYRVAGYVLRITKRWLILAPQADDQGRTHPGPRSVRGSPMSPSCRCARLSCAHCRRYHRLGRCWACLLASRPGAAHPFL